MHEHGRLLLSAVAVRSDSVKQAAAAAAAAASAAVASASPHVLHFFHSIDSAADGCSLHIAATVLDLKRCVQTGIMTMLVTTPPPSCTSSATTIMHSHQSIQRCRAQCRHNFSKSRCSLAAAAEMKAVALQGCGA
jgi:hypothetical protein